MTHLLRTVLLLASLAWLALLPAQAQRTAAYGDWQLHLPTNRARVLADAGPRVYVAAENSFFAFDKETSTIQLLSRRDGLTDVGVNTLAYDSLTQQVVVVYNSGTVDILNPAGRVVTTITDIRRKQVTGAKLIYGINCARRLAYLSTSFGVVVLDLQRYEVRDTYVNIGPNGTVPQVFATTVLGDSLYAATSAGLLRGRLTANLLNFVNWRGTPGFGPRAGDPYRTLVTHQGKVYAGIQGDNLYRAVGGNWLSQNYGDFALNSLRSSAAGLLISRPGALDLYDPRTRQVRRRLAVPLMANVQDATRAASGELYLADLGNGLLRAPAGSSTDLERFTNNAPATARAFNILPDPASRTVTVFPGGYSDRYLQQGQRDGFYVFDADGRWTNVTATTLPGAAQFPDPLDLSRGTRTPEGTLYVASYGQGVLEWKGPSDFRLYGLDNSPLRSAIPLSSDPNRPNFVRVTDVAAAPDGSVWAVNRHQQALFPGLHRFLPAQNRWESLPNFPGSGSLERLTFDDLGRAWICRDRRDGLSVTAYDPETNALANFTINEGLPNNNLWDIVKDRAGAIWVGTSAGVAVHETPGEVFTSSTSFRKPFVTRGIGTGFDALYSEIVRCIAVDGANRKWFGTENGLWLFNEGATESLLHFTTDNSPLPSNRIVDVAVDDRTGEVWVGTDNGLVTYRGSASVTEGKPSCAKVFPNPVRQDYSGQVGISGLANNAEVKITDVSGALVYQTRAAGGTVTWNLNDVNGRRVRSGVYLVLSADANGQNGCISKVAVLTR